jgi:DNA primase
MHHGPAPVSWRELARTESATTYTVQNLKKRLARLKQSCPICAR